MTPEIVPRWEWRTFGERLEKAFAGLEPERVQDSEEIYLLSTESDSSVKVRAGVMDVKELQEVNAEGLEQWKPVLKGEFPLSAEDAASVLSALGVEAPVEGEYGLDRLLSGVVAPNAALRSLEVRKHREHFTVGGAMAELSEITVAEGSRTTVAVESEDPAAVVAAVGELGFAGRRNVCLPRGLKVLAGFGARRYAVIDVGTNSVKFHVGERSADCTWTVVVDRAEVTRLGEGLDETGRLGEAPMERTATAIAEMTDEAKREGAAEIAAVGTAGLRIASNNADFVDAVRARTGVEVEVIPGEEEARLAYLATTEALGTGSGSLAVFDTGGGSSQFTFGRGREVDERFSVNVGAARIAERFGLDGKTDDETLHAALEAIGADLDRLDGHTAPDAVVGMGGAVTNLAAVKHGLEAYDPDVVQGTELDRDEIDRQIELYRERSADERRAEIVGLQPKRAEVILAGACIVRTILDKLGRESFTVSDRGLRHGLLAERFGC